MNQRIIVRDSESGCDFGNERIHDLSVLMEVCSDDEELMLVIPRVLAGETVMIGGGAQPLLWLRMV